MTGDADLVPANVRAAIDAYVDRRAPVTFFVRALIANDLLDCCAYAPKDFTMAQLRACERLVFNRIPGRARGSAVAVDAWLSGKTAAAAAPTTKGEP